MPIFETVVARQARLFLAAEGGASDWQRGQKWLLRAPITTRLMGR
jgi:hypothetical protein